MVRANLVEDGAHLGIAGNGLKAEDRAEIVIAGAALEGKQGGVFETEQSQAGHQGVGQGEVGTATLFGYLVEPAAGELNERVNVKVSALPPTSSLAHNAASWPVHAIVTPRSLVYENGGGYCSCFKQFGSRRELLSLAYSPLLSHP